MRKIILLLVLLAASPVSAQSVDPLNKIWPLGTVISAKACNDTAANRAFTVADVALERGYNLLVVTFDFTWVDATDVTLTCTHSPDAGTTKATLQDCTVSAGNCTSDDVKFTKSVTASKIWPWRVDVTGFYDVTCTFACTEAVGGGDLLTMKGYLTPD